MVEDTLRRNQRDLQLARRRGVSPSQHLKPHFVALARQVWHWAQSRDSFVTGSGPSIGITSLAPGAGKSTIAFNLASASISITRGQVLLLESDFGNPYISRRLGHTKAPGLSEVLNGDSEYIDALLSTPLTDLAMISCGLSSNQQALDLPFDLLPHLIDERSHEYSLIVVDLPVATQLTSCHSIMPHLDGVILTVESHQLDQRQIVRFRQQAEHLGVEIIGVVINKA